MRVITIASTKGGVGKTTLASALAVKAATESPRVAMVDLDPLVCTSETSGGFGRARSRPDQSCFARKRNPRGSGVVAPHSSTRCCLRAMLKRTPLSIHDCILMAKRIGVL